MRIYVDESGSFCSQPDIRRRVACVGALVIPDHVHEKLITKYCAMRSPWLRSGRKVKGRELREDQIDAVVRLLAQNDILFEVVGTDLEFTDPLALTALRLERAEALRERKGPLDRLPDGRAIADFADEFEAQSSPLFLQGLITISLVWQVIQASTAYYAQRLPRELGTFQWVFDGKQLNSPTMNERLWRDLIAPLAAMRPGGLHWLPGADYSAFEPFSVSFEALGLPAPEKPAMDSATDLNKVFCNDVTFTKARDEIGLELVDVVLSGFSRAVNGTLQPSGWRALGSLVVRRPPISFHMIRAVPDDGRGTVRADVPYGRVLRAMDAIAKPMFTRKFKHLESSIAQLDLTPL